MANETPAGVQRITVRLGYRDPIGAIAFLQDAFGFQERRDNRLEGKGGTIIVAEISVGDSYIMIGPAGAHGIDSPATSGRPTESLMVYVEGIDDHYQRAKENGAQIVSEPSDQYWGDRRYETKDIEGHIWFFHERTRNVSREEIERIEAGFKNG